MHVNYPGFSFSLLFLRFLWSRACPFTEHTCVGTKTKMAAGWCVCFVCFMCFLLYLSWHLHVFIHVQSFYFFLYHLYLCVWMCVLIYCILFISYACFEHNESIKVFVYFFPPSCLKNSSKKLVSAKNLPPQTPKQNRKKRHLRREKKSKIKRTLGSLFESPNLSTGFQQSQGTTLPSWYVAEQGVFVLLLHLWK